MFNPRMVDIYDMDKDLFGEVTTTFVIYFYHNLIISNSMGANRIRNNISLFEVTKSISVIKAAVQLILLMRCTNLTMKTSSSPRGPLARNTTVCISTSTPTTIPRPS